MKRALDLNAAGIIIVHNHPSGDPTPSNADIQITHQLQEIEAIPRSCGYFCNGIGFCAYDHLALHVRHRQPRAKPRYHYERDRHGIALAVLDSNLLDGILRVRGIHPTRLVQIPGETLEARTTN